MALGPEDYEFLTTMLLDMTRYDKDRTVTRKALRCHMGEKILRHAKAQNSSFNETKFRELANLPIE